MILLVSNKETYGSKRLKQELGIKNYEVRIQSVFELFEKNKRLDVSKFNTLYIRGAYYNESPEFLPQVVELAKEFKEAGKRVVDANIADGFLGLGKWEDYKKLKEAAVSIPETRILSESVVTDCFAIKPSLNDEPKVAKWTHGMKAQYVHLVSSRDQLQKFYNQYPKGELLLQEYIQAEWEYKVITVGYKALPVVVRFKIKDLRFGIDFKTSKALKIYKIDQKIIQLAEKASKTLGRELAKVDILEKDGRFYVLEVNRCPGFKSFEQISGFNVAGEFVNYLIK